MSKKSKNEKAQLKLLTATKSYFRERKRTILFGHRESSSSTRAQQRIPREDSDSEACMRLLHIPFPFLKYIKIPTYVTGPLMLQHEREHLVCSSHMPPASSFWETVGSRIPILAWNKWLK